VVPAGRQAIFNLQSAIFDRQLRSPDAKSRTPARPGCRFPSAVLMVVLAPCPRGRATAATAGLLASGSSYLPSLPIARRRQWISRRSSPVTAAGPRRSRTVFPWPSSRPECSGRRLPCRAALPVGTTYLNHAKLNRNRGLECNSEIRVTAPRVRLRARARKRRLSRARFRVPAQQVGRPVPVARGARAQPTGRAGAPPERARHRGESRP
jgi:hypothetical protein